MLPASYRQCFTLTLTLNELESSVYDNSMGTDFYNSSYFPIITSVMYIATC